ncbi:MAG: Phenylacetic acid catabolic protein [Candidatus Dormibacteraceae bacterium]
MSLSDLVLSAADAKQLLGLRYAEWAVRAPSLEADIAAAAMGLDEIGHSRVLYGCLDPLGDDPRGPERQDDPAVYRNLACTDSSFPTWEHFVAANAIVDNALSVLLRSMLEGSSEVLRTRLRKMLNEEKYHLLHGRSWLAQETSDLTSGALGDAWREALELFGPPDGELAELASTGALSAGPADLRQRLEERIGLPGPDLEIDWPAWDRKRRRTTPGAIDAATFAMLRGLEERAHAPAGARRA